MGADARMCVFGVAFLNCGITAGQAY